VARKTAKKSCFSVEIGPKYSTDGYFSSLQIHGLAVNRHIENTDTFGKPSIDPQHAGRWLVEQAAPKVGCGRSGTTFDDVPISDPELCN
jgi:hypothetical protein